MEAITSGELKISEITGEYLVIDVNYEVTPNNHGRANVLLRMLNNSDPVNEIRNLEDKMISIKSKTAGILFKGYVESAQAIVYKNDSALELKLVTTSIMMDKEYKSYSFQKDDKKLCDIIYEAVKDDGGICEYIDNTVENEKIVNPVIRYEESAWVFVNRIASRYWMPVFVDEMADKPTVRVGIKGEGSASSSDFLTKSIKKKVVVENYLYRSRGDKKANVKIDDYKLIEINSYANYKIGMSASYKDISGIILSKRAYIDKGELVFTYVIGDPKIYAQRPSYNRKLHGRCLEGKVVKCENENIKLQLDIDKNADKVKSESDLFFFPWQPEIGNLVYTMPEKDTVVSLYVGEKDEGNAIVINNLRKNKGKDIDKPENRYFTTDSGKRMYYAKDEMGFSNDGKNQGKTYLNMKDSSGINFETDKIICIQADGKVAIKSKSDMTLSAKKRINLLSSKKSINFDKKFNADASAVKLGMGVCVPESVDEAETITLESGLSKYVKDEFEGTGKDLQDNFNAYLRTTVWCRTDLSNQQKVDIMKANFCVLSKEQKKDFNVIGDVRVIGNKDYTNWGEWPTVTWPPFPGLDHDKEVTGVTKDNLPSSLDRIGYVGGKNFGIIPEDGYKYTQNERAIPYIENKEAYNQYTLDTNNYFEAIDCIKSSDCDGMNSLIDNINKEKGLSIAHISETEMESYNQDYMDFQNNKELKALCADKNVDSTYGVFGSAAPWNTESGEKICDGGAAQLNTPISGATLKGLGILEDV